MNEQIRMIETWPKVLANFIEKREVKASGTVINARGSVLYLKLINSIYIIG